MDSKIEQLQELLSKLPGIGPRQARRFVFFFLRAPSPMIDQLFNLIQELRNQRKICAFCQKIHFQNEMLCEICTSKNRSHEQILIVAKNSDMEVIEKSGLWNGRYFILGRTLRTLEQNPEKAFPLSPLKNLLQENAIEEIVFGLPVNPEGEETQKFIQDELRKISDHIAFSQMGRGLSTGSELEYADPATIKSALENRS